MDFYSVLSLAKVFSRVVSGNGNMPVSEAEIEAASELLKSLGDNRQDWTYQQKEAYKALVDFTKENSKRHQDG